MRNGLKTGGIVAALLALVMASGCATAIRHGLIDPEDIATSCEDIRLACEVGGDVDIKAKMACERILPICDVVAPATSTTVTPTT